MKVNPYLSFDGNCAEAMAFYRDCLGGGGTLNVKLHRDSPSSKDVGPEMQDRVMHAHLETDGVVIMASDIPSAHYTVPSPMVQVALSVETDESAEEIFAKLSEGATVFMPIQQTFWANRFGMLKDRFGVPWMVSSEQLPA